MPFTRGSPCVKKSPARRMLTVRAPRSLEPSARVPLTPDKPKTKRPKAIVLTSHPGGHGPKPVPIVWGAADPAVRGPVVATVTDRAHRNVIGTHSGSYSLYRALAVAAGALDPLRKPDLTDTSPTSPIGPHPQWFNPERIVSLDPFGAVAAEVWKTYLDQGYDIRPTIAITRAHIRVPELVEAMTMGRLKAD